MFQAFLGVEASNLEQSEADRRLSKVCASQQRIYNRQFALNLAIYGFDYLVNYSWLG